MNSCESCCRAKFRTPDTTHHWPKESTPWSRAHIDWAFHRTAGNILVVADSSSGWLEVDLCRNRTTITVIDRLRAFFARFGVLNVIVSDNAPEFTCQQFRGWLKAIGCRLLHTPEYHPQSNGLAERMVRVVKDAVKCYNPAKCSVQAFIHRLLMVHRNSALRGDKTPAEIMLARTLRCPIISHFKPMQQLLYKAHNKAETSMVKFLFKQGQNTSLVAHPDGRAIMAHDAQIAAAPDGTQRPVRTRQASQALSRCGSAT